jgi:hypothetical protein
MRIASDHLKERRDLTHITIRSISSWVSRSFSRAPPSTAHAPVCRHWRGKCTGAVGRKETGWNRAVISGVESIGEAGGTTAPQAIPLIRAAEIAQLQANRTITVCGTLRVANRDGDSGVRPYSF